MTDWTKVMEVFGSGIIGVYLVMVILQLLTQLTTRLIDLVENHNKTEDDAAQPRGNDNESKG